ncbi:hypothetical protein [Nannocystis punicea]|uniref:Uncharacterized protein n=1 Tax=Nannocystis punicea TaxID=2995304 RepID=A0ABY7H8U4_9BACT|nr:hypothetical protein [Nannocystis poenicansa]WAS95656.1 hypothetical protein O0S08_05795 [Nannocystis poenicansa]
MPTITLRDNAYHDANAIILMTAQPMKIALTALTGQGVRFQCSNALATIQGATSVDITFDAAHHSEHQNVQVSSVQP